MELVGYNWRVFLGQEIYLDDVFGNVSQGPLQTWAHLVALQLIFSEQGRNFCTAFVTYYLNRLCEMIFREFDNLRVMKQFTYFNVLSQMYQLVV
jgi:hypothetical protein